MSSSEFFRLTGSELRQLILLAARESENPVYRRLVRFYLEQDPGEFKKQMLVVDLEQTAQKMNSRLEAIEWNRNYQNFLMECKNYRITKNPTYIQTRLFGLPVEVPELDADLEKLARLMHEEGEARKKLDSVEKLMSVL